jgi:hypothetical protein
MWGAEAELGGEQGPWPPYVAKKFLMPPVRPSPACRHAAWKASPNLHPVISIRIESKLEEETSRMRRDSCCIVFAPYQDGHHGHHRERKPSRTGHVVMLGLGGTGRVGGSTTTSLSRLRPDLDILVGGSYHRCVREQPFLLWMKKIDDIYRCYCPILI